jgi:hypothetical protein
LLALAGQRLRKTHDLDDLVAEVAPLYPDLASSLDFMRGLTVWGVAYRYPGMGDEPEPEPTLADLNGVAAQVEALMALVERLAGP